MVENLRMLDEFISFLSPHRFAIKREQLNCFSKMGWDLDAFYGVDSYG